MTIAHAQRRRRGFTLAEVLLVLVILVILVSLAVPTYTGARKKANINSARTQIGLFRTPLEMYSLDMNCFPTTEQGLEALREAPSGLADQSKWGPDPYLEGKIPLDPWGSPYQYQCPGRRNQNSYDIWSWGPDRQDGTNDDIGNWEKE
jgi:general secretion pathway protein G